MTIGVERDGQWVNVKPEDLTTDELCWALSMIQISPDSFLSQKEIDEGYAAITESGRRLLSTK